ncbi:N-6 DNA methylase (plasmid) [Metaplanococcus flavidus]
MNNNKESFNMVLDSLRGPLKAEEYIEPIAVGVALEKLKEIDGHNFNYIELIIRAGDEGRKVLKSTLGEFENKHPFLKGVFQELPALNRLSVSELSVFWFEFQKAVEGIADLNKWFDDFIQVYNTNLYRVGGENSSPTIINYLALQLIKPKVGSFHDSMAGLGGSLRAADQFSKEQEGSIELSGQEINKKLWAISKIRMFAAGREDAEIHSGDVLLNPHFVEGNKLKKFDYIFIDSPFGLSIENYEIVQADQYNRFLFGVPPRRSFEIAVISHVIAALNNSGRGITVVSSGTLFRSGAEEKIRSNMISSDVIEAVIALPGGLYDHTSIPSNLILFNKNKSAVQKNKILFVNAEDLAIEHSRKKKTLSSETVNKIVKAVSSSESVPEFSKLVAIEDIQRGNLSPNQYITATDMKVTDFGKVEFSIEALSKVETRPLDELVTFFRGYNASSKDEAEDGQYKFLKISDVQDGEIELDKLSRYNIDSNSKLSAHQLHKGDVIVSIRGQNIKVAEIPVEEENLLLSQNFMGIRCSEELNPTYLKMYLESPVGQYLLSTKIAGSVIPTLSKNELKKLEIPIKSVKEQEIIASNYIKTEKSISDEIKALEKKLLESKLEVYEQMGLSEVFMIKD